MSEHKYYIPISIADPVATAQKYNTTLPLINNAYAFLGYLWHIQYGKKVDGYVRQVELNAQRTYKEVLSLKLASVTRLLTKMGLIERGRSYVVGERCKIHKLTENAVAMDWIDIPFDDLFKGKKQTNLIAKRKRALKKVKDLGDGDLKESVINMLKLAPGLKIEENNDLKEAIETKVADAYTKYEAERKKDSSLPFIPVIQFAKNEVDSINRINKGDWIEHTGIGNNGRLYSPLTNLARVYREMLMPWNDKQYLINVDMRACQPCLLPVYYDESNPAHMAEKAKYVALVTSKETDIYEFIAKKIGMTRAQVKKPFIQVIFGQDKISRTHKVGKAMREAFPILFGEILPAIRQQGTKNYKLIAKRMQKLESDIFIRGAFVDFYKSNKNKPCFPIHDSFMVLPESVEEITRLIHKHVKAVMGFEPVIKADDLIVDLPDETEFEDDFDWGDDFNDVMSNVIGYNENF